MKAVANVLPHHLKRETGFTLVESMVAMTIGLVFALMISLGVLSMGRQFQTVGASSTAQVNAQLALSLMDDAGRAAGAGLYNNGQLTCPTINIWRDGTLISNGATLVPARITDGGSATASDTLVFVSSKANGPLSSIPVLDAMASSTASIVVSTAGVIAQNDLAIVGVPGAAGVPCTLFQVTAAPTVGTACGGNATQCRTLPRGVNPATGYNPLAGTFAAQLRYAFGNDPVAGIYGPAVVQRLGSALRPDGFAVMCGALVHYNAFTVVPGCSQTPLSFNAGTDALATDVVLMHSQYGISASAASDVVTNWVNALGGWANPSAADVGRIKAVRVVVVVRAKEPDSTLVTAANCTNGNGVVNTGPCSFDDAEAPIIDLSAVSVPAGRSWRNYRYRVHQSVIPLRNLIWGT